MKKVRTKTIEKVASVLTVVILIAAWFMGGQRHQQNAIAQLQQATIGSSEFRPVNGSVYKGLNPEGGAAGWYTVQSAPGYGGPLTTVLSVDPEGKIAGVAIVESRETSTYLHKVTDSGLVDGFINQLVSDLPEVDGISGATLTTHAISRSIAQGSDAIARQIFELEPGAPESVFPAPAKLDFLLIAMFIAAIVTARVKFKRKKQARWALLLSSIVVIGFYSSSQFSTATLSFLLSGMWTRGVASYSAILLLSMAIGYMLYTNKNLYCSYICPFGAAQECIGCITNPKAVRLKHPLFVWFPRVILLTVLVLGLYFRNPGSFTFEPFGILFNMIGSTFLFVLTILIVLSSLVIHRPWCQQLCPVTQLFEFIRFNGQWIKQAVKSRG